VYLVNARYAFSLFLSQAFGIAFIHRSGQRDFGIYHLDLDLGRIDSRPFAGFTLERVPDTQQPQPACGGQCSEGYGFPATVNCLTVNCLTALFSPSPLPLASSESTV
jgi:hypothetical protein